MKRAKYPLLLCVALSVGTLVLVNRPATNVKAGGETVVWDFTAKATGHSNYSDTWTYGGVCEIEGAANNNAGWGYIRIGGKSGSASNVNNDSLSSIRSVGAVSEPIESVSLTFANYSSNTAYTLNQITLEVSNAEFDGPSTRPSADSVWNVETSETTFDVGAVTNENLPSGLVVTFSPSSGAVWQANSFYRLTFDFENTSTSKNYGCDLQKVEFKVGNESTAPVESLVIHNDGGSNLIQKIGGTIQLTADVLPSDASQAVEWESSNDSVATVSSSGLVTAGIEEGEAVIKATSKVDSAKYDEYTIIVAFDYDIDRSDMFVMPTDFPETEVTVPTIGELSNGYPIEYSKANYYYYSAGGIDEISIKGNGGYFSNLLAIGPISRIILFPASSPQYINVDVTFGDAFANNEANKVEATSRTTTDGTTYWEYVPEGGFEYFKVMTNSNYSQYLSAVIVEYATDANVWAQLFLEETSAVCELTQLDHTFDEKGIWEESAELYEMLDDENKGYLSKEYQLLGGEAITDIQKAVERYKWIAVHYADKGLEPFMTGIELSGYVTPFLESNDDVGTVVACASLGLLTIACGLGFAFYKKRKEAR